MRNLHYFLFILLSTSIGPFVFAQVVPEIEVSGSFLTTNNSNFRGQGGVGAGVNLSIFDDKPFNLVVGLNFGANYYWTNLVSGGKYEPYKEGKDKASSIYVPVLLRYNTSGTTKFIAEIGPALEVALDYYKSYFIAGHVALGVRFPVGTNEMIAKAFYHYTPGTVTLDNTGRWYFNASYVGLSIGYRILKK